MSEKELCRKTVFEEVRAGRMTRKAAGRRLGLCYRQVCRSYKRWQHEGDAGLAHGNRGRPSNRARPDGFKNKVLARYRARYSGFGATLASEKLAGEGLVVDHETLRRWLLAAGLLMRRRKHVQHRQRRPRKEHFGEMVQMDGSVHRWFGPDKGQDCKMTMIDDATGQRLALMDTGETTELAMRALWLWVDQYGIPQSLYTDRKSVFITDREPTVEEQLAGQEPLTAFGKACKKLGIEIIAAYSPQAKGRVERCHGVFQDRFVKELGLRRIRTIAAANNLLLGGFTDELNTKFAREPANPVDFHRPVPKGLDLANLFCFEQYRVVQNDWTVRYQNHHYQIDKASRPLPKPKDKVVVRVRLDKSMQILYRDTPLVYRRLPKQEVRARHANKSAADKPVAPRGPRQSPLPDSSPWRQGCTLMFADTNKKNKP